MSNIAQFRPPDVVREDTELARGLRDRRPDALRRLADRFGHRLHTVARCLGVDPGRAEQVTVSALLVAWDGAAAIEPGDDLAPWMADVLEQQLVGFAPDEQLRLAARIELVWSVADALAALDPVDQRILRAIHVAGQGAADVAPRVGLPVDDVVARSVRAHQRLARRLHHLADDHEPNASNEPSESYVDERGRPTGGFDAAVGDDAATVLADPAMWAPVPDHVIDDVLAAAGLADGSGEPTSDRAVASAAERTERPHPSSRWRQVRAGIIGGVLTIVFLTAGIVAFSAAGEPPATATFDAELVPTGLVPDAEGAVEVTELDGGLEVTVDAPSLPRRVQGSFYEGWLRLEDGRLVPIGTFQTGIEVTLFAGVDLDDVTELVISLGEALSDDGARSGPDDVVLKTDIPPPGS